MYNWHKAMNISELVDNKPTEITVGDKQLGLLKRDGTVFAFAALCPHTSAPLCEGWIDARGHIVCPLHSYRFNPANGYNSSGEGYKLKTYPVEIRDNEIFVGILS